MKPEPYDTKMEDLLLESAKHENCPHLRKKAVRYRMPNGEIESGDSYYICDLNEKYCWAEYGNDLCETWLEIWTEWQNEENN